ncbi:MAG: 16S rRNA (guanine(966)-N(2))-methyltransferase RsmD [Planctomycetaceae bacterium]|nr:16S rRNA (guanine(966)-N(2))-methyltransferase RsmD [Planctomycetaceae bacterium]
MSLRIIAGEFRRRKLATPAGNVTRPYTDRVRQMVFDRISHLVEDARVADVFAGVGTMGLEALSRGAHSCVFFEADRVVHQHLKENVQTIASQRETLCWKTDIHRTSFCPTGAEECLPYDLVFFDPPYEQAPLLNNGGVLSRCMARLSKPRATDINATVLLRTPDRFDLESQEGWRTADCWHLSSMKIWVLEKSSAEQSEPEHTDA